MLSIGAKRKEVFDALSVREREVLECLRKGFTNPQIGAALNIRKSTVRGHVSRLLLKFGVRSRQYFHTQLDEDIGNKK
jgi:DNA-binding NarL/FixJ family response regulator